MAAPLPSGMKNKDLRIWNLSKAAKLKREEKITVNWLRLCLLLPASCRSLCCCPTVGSIFSSSQTSVSPGWRGALWGRPGTRWPKPSSVQAAGTSAGQRTRPRVNPTVRGASLSCIFKENKKKRAVLCCIDSPPFPSHSSTSSSGFGASVDASSRGSPLPFQDRTLHLCGCRSASLSLLIVL